MVNLHSNINNPELEEEQQQENRQKLNKMIHSMVIQTYILTLLQLLWSYQR